MSSFADEIFNSNEPAPPGEEPVPPGEDEEELPTSDNTRGKPFKSIDRMNKC